MLSSLHDVADHPLHGLSSNSLNVYIHSSTLGQDIVHHPLSETLEVFPSLTSLLQQPKLDVNVLLNTTDFPILLCFPVEDITPSNPAGTEYFCLICVGMCTLKHAQAGSSLTLLYSLLPYCSCHICKQK